MGRHQTIGMYYRYQYKKAVCFAFVIRIWMYVVSSSSLATWFFCDSLDLWSYCSGSSVALEAPDFSIHPRARHSVEHSQKVVLHAGDALFIPEGW